MDAGATPTVTVLLTNVGNAPLTLSMSYVTPSYIHVTWNRGGYLLPIGGTVVAVLTIATDANSVAGAFSGSVTITGTAI
jgi:hypothetical protein